MLHLSKINRLNVKFECEMRVNILFVRDWKYLVNKQPGFITSGTSHPLLTVSAIIVQKTARGHSYLIHTCVHVFSWKTHHMPQIRKCERNGVKNFFLPLLILSKPYTWYICNSICKTIWLHSLKTITAKFLLWRQLTHVYDN